MNDDREEELLHGGLVARSGNMVTLGDGSRWWLNGQPWARNEADATIAHDLRVNTAASIDPRITSYRN